jgi:hypothetical protein
MKVFSSTDLRTKSNSAYKAVEIEGAAKIKHRDRGNMILITVEKLEKILASKTHRELFAEDMQA